MSHVTDVILSVCIDEDIGEIQTYLRRKHASQSLLQVDQHAGGGKAVQQDVWMGAFNGLDMPALEAVFANAKFEWTEQAQLMLKDEHEDLFRVIARD